MEGLSSLQDLRVLNLAGNCLRCGHEIVPPAHHLGGVGHRALFVPRGASCIDWGYEARLGQTFPEKCVAPYLSRDPEISGKNSDTVS